jgi:hypothetical protein
MSGDKREPVNQDLETVNSTEAKMKKVHGSQGKYYIRLLRRNQDRVRIQKHQNANAACPSSPRLCQETDSEKTEYKFAIDSFPHSLPGESRPSGRY